MTWRINETVQFKDRTYRILAVNSSELIWIDVHHRRAVPEFRHFLKLEQLTANEAIHKVEDPFDFLRLEEPSITSTAHTKRAKAFSLIEPLILDDSCFEPKTRSRKARHAALENSASLATVYKYLRRYWQRGQIPNALLPDYRNCGAPGKSKAELSGKKPGRKRLYSDCEGTKVSPDIQRLFHRNIQATLMNSKGRNITSSYKDFLILYTTNFPRVKPADYPTLRQYKYYYYKNFKIDVRLKAQYDKSTYNKDIRPLHSTATANVLGPAHRYEIDATIADIYLVDDEDTDKIIGRPTIYMIIDVYSRMVAVFFKIVGTLFCFKQPIIRPVYAPAFQGSMSSVQLACNS